MFVIIYLPQENRHICLTAYPLQNMLTKPSYLLDDFEVHLKAKRTRLLPQALTIYWPTEKSSDIIYLRKAGNLLTTEQDLQFVHI